MRESDEYQQSQLFRRRRGLGDLTESKKEERGEFAQNSGAKPTELPSESAQPQTPKIQSGVMPSYDVLPANAGRFNFGQQGNAVVAHNTSSTYDAVVFTAVVPAGRVVLARKFRVNMDKTDTNSFSIPPDPFQITLFVNGNAEIYNQQIFAQPFDDWYACQLIAGPLDIITISVKGEFGPSAIGTITFISHVSGDMLLPNELPIPYTALRQTAFPVFNG